MKFVRVFVESGGDIEKLQNQANEWVYQNQLKNVEYRYQMTAAEGYPFLISSIMVIYEAFKPIQIQEEKIEEQELVPEDEGSWFK